MSKTFTHDVKYLEVVPVFTNGEPEYTRQKVSKNVTFMELDQLDRSQHELHYLIMAYYSSGGVKMKGKSKAVVDSEFAREMTNEYLEKMIVFNDEFTARDKEALLNDSGALIRLGLFVIQEKVFPFFLQLTESIAA